MTLVISLATHKYTFQISDRRLVQPNGQIYDDQSNKAVFFCNQLTIAYAGLAHIDSMRTDLWITKVLADAACRSGSDAIYTIRDKATEAFAKMSFTAAEKRHAFVVAGWTRSDQNDPLRPMICSVSNFHDNDERPLPEATDFRVRVYILNESDALALLSTGQDIPTERRISLMRTLRKCIKKKVGPRTLLNIVITEFDHLAASNDAIGRNFLVSVLPKQAVEAAGDSFTVVAGFTPNSPSFLYYSEKGDGIIYGPNFICDGTAMTNFEAGSL